MWYPKKLAYAFAASRSSAAAGGASFGPAQIEQPPAVRAAPSFRGRSHVLAADAVELVH